MTSISGRDPHTGRNIEVVIRDGIIAAINDVPSADPAWLSTGLIDLQINGYQGFDFNADNLTSDTVIDLSRSVLATGVTTFLPTIITASEEKIIACLRAIAAARPSSTAGNKPPAISSNWSPCLHTSMKRQTTLQRCATEMSSYPSAIPTLYPSKSAQQSTPDHPSQLPSATALTIRYRATLTSFGRN